MVLVALFLAFWAGAAIGDRLFSRSPEPAPARSAPQAEAPYTYRPAQGPVPAPETRGPVPAPTVNRSEAGGEKRVAPSRSASATVPVPPPMPPHEDLRPAHVLRVYDGDTVLAAVYGFPGHERVRLIGIDCPEVTKGEPFADRAREFTAELVLPGPVHLEFDRELRDGYGRLLAYVWLADGRMVNAELIRANLARPLAVSPNVKYRTLFEDLAARARATKGGVWGAESPPPYRTPRGLSCAPGPCLRGGPGSRGGGPAGLGRTRKLRLPLSRICRKGRRTKAERPAVEPRSGLREITGAASEVSRCGTSRRMY